MNVIPVGTRRELITFKTPEKAIAFSENHPLKKREISDSKKIKGTAIIEGFWTENEFAIKFSNGLWVHIYIEKDTVKWNIVENKPVFDSEKIEGIGANPIKLLWNNSKKPFVMDRSKLLKKRIGKEFTQLFYNFDGFYIYIKNQLILAFHATYRTDTNDAMLYVLEDD